VSTTSLDIRKGKKKYTTHEIIRHERQNVLFVRCHCGRSVLLGLDLERGCEAEVTLYDGALVVARKVPRLSTGWADGAGPAEDTLLQVPAGALCLDDGGAGGVFSARGWSMARERASVSTKRTRKERPSQHIQLGPRRNWEDIPKLPRFKARLTTSLAFTVLTIKSAIQPTGRMNTGYMGEDLPDDTLFDSGDSRKPGVCVRAVRHKPVGAISIFNKLTFHTAFHS
jgi:hypothetical protein